MIREIDGCARVRMAIFLWQNMGLVCRKMSNDFLLLLFTNYILENGLNL